MSNYIEYADVAGTSPLPAWTLSSLLIARGIANPKPVASNLGSVGGSYKFSMALAAAKPSRISCFGFGAASALGGWILFDGDLLNGTGFSAAWSTLYLLVNGRPAVKSIVSGHVTPALLSVIALGNAAVYGRQFFWGSIQPGAVALEE